MQTRRRWGLVLFAALASGCFSDEGGRGCATGLVGNGSFSYVCVSDVDAQCAGLGASSAVPPTVALGSRFGVTFARDGETESAGIAVKPVSDAAVAVEGDGFTTARAGRVGFVAYEGETALDATRVTVVAPSRLEIGRANGGGFLFQALGSWPLTLAVGGSEALAARPIDERGGALPGTLVATWTVDDPTIASVTTRPDGTCELRAEKEGTTRLRVTGASLEATVELVVGDGASPGPDAGADVDAGDNDGGSP